MQTIGYARVSTREERQVFDRQMDALRAAGCGRIYDDRGSGASTDRPGLKAYLDYLRKGDVLVVLDLERLGRLGGELIRLVDKLGAREVGFRALNAFFDTTTPMGRAFLQIQAAFAEMARNVIRQCKGGRPWLMTLKRLRYAQHLMADKSCSVPAICRESGGVPASTLYDYLHADGRLKATGLRLLGQAAGLDLQESGAASGTLPRAV